MNSHSKPAACADAIGEKSVSRRVKILILEDVESDAELEIRALREADIDMLTKVTSNRKDFVDALDRFCPDLVISDYRLPDIDGHQAITIVRAKSESLPFILVTGVLGDEAAVELMQAGITDYVLKDRLARLGPAAKRAVAEAGEIRRRKAAEAANAELAHIIETAQFAVIGIDLDGSVTSWNEGARKMHGYDASEIMGRPISILMAPGHQWPMKELCARVAAHEKIAPFETRHVSRDGALVALNMTLSPIRGANGEIAGVSVVGFDITERIHAADKLAAASLYARNILEANIDPLIVINAEGKITDVNRAAVHITGTVRENLVGSDIAAHFTEPDRAHACCHEVLSGGFVLDYPFVIRSASGEGAEVLLNANVYRDGAGQIGGVVASMRDVSESKRREREFARMQDQLLATVRELREHQHEIFVIDELGETMQTSNARAEAYPLIMAAGRALFEGSSGALAIFADGATYLQKAASWGPASKLADEFAPQDCWGLRRGHVHEYQANGNDPLCQHFEKPPEGSYLCVPLSIGADALGLLHVELAGGISIDDRIRQLVNTFADAIKVSLANIDLREALRRQAIHDPLTGLYNRNYLNDVLARELRRAQRQHSPVSLAMIDIDHFKRFNDEFGHEAGDAVLKKLGAVLHAAIRESDVACRYGGEEFLLMLTDTDCRAAESVAEKIRTRLSQDRIRFGGKALPPVTISAGISQLPRHGLSAEDLIAAADRALYAAKNAGRNRVRISDGDQPQAMQNIPGARISG